MTKTTSLAGAIEIASHEGIVPYRYVDSVGVATWGIGHTAGAGAPDPRAMPFAEEAALGKVIEVFRRDLRKFEKRVASAVKVPLEQHEFDALVSFDFNTGGIHRAQLTKTLNAGGGRAVVAARFMGWSRPREIVGRRKKEQALFRDGAYVANGMATVFPADESGRVKWAQGKRVAVVAAMGNVVAANTEDDKADRALNNGAKAGGGAGASGGATQLPEVGSGDTTVVLILIAVVLGAIAGGFAWRWWRKRQAARVLNKVAAGELATAMTVAPVISADEAATAEAASIHQTIAEEA